MLFKVTFKTKAGGQGEFQVEAPTFPKALSDAGNTMNAKLKGDFNDVIYMRVGAVVPSESGFKYVPPKE